MDPNHFFNAVSATIAANLMFAWLPGLVGSKRGRSFWTGFFLSFVLQWLPALLLMSVLPPARPRRAAPPDIETLQAEKRRMDEAERRARQGSASPPTVEHRRNRAITDRLGRAGSAPETTAAELPAAPAAAPPTVPLPAGFHPDPLADAPRADLRSGARSTGAGSATDPGALSADGSP